MAHSLVAMLFVTAATTGLFLLWVAQSFRHAGVAKAGSRLMLVGLGIFILSMPSCLGCGVVMGVFGSPMLGAWSAFWLYWMAIGLLAIFSGMVLKCAGGQEAAGRENDG